MNVNIQTLNDAYTSLSSEYDTMINEDADYYDLKDKLLKDSQAIQIQLMMRWQNFHRNVDSILKIAKQKLDEVYGEAYLRMKKESKFDYNSTEMKYVVETDETLQKYRTIYNRIYVLRDKASDMVKLTEQRHWVIKELVTTMVNDGDLWVA